jgi:dTMP kinase
LPAPAPRAEVLLLLAARAQHVAQVIEPALAAGRDVVCDRFDGSTLAYQGFGRGFDPSELARLSRWASAGVTPDLVILLKLDAGTAGRRRAGRGAEDRIEGEGAEFFARVDTGYDALAAADPGHWRVVDASGTVEEVARRVAAAAGMRP